MGVFDPDYKRLALIIMIFLFLTIMYSGEAMLLLNQDERMNEYHYGYLDDTERGLYDPSFNGSRETLDSNYTSDIQSSRTEIGDVGDNLLGFVQFISFTSPDIGIFSWFFTPLVTIFWIIGIYLTIDIVYDIVKALPFT